MYFVYCVLDSQFIDREFHLLINSSFVSRHYFASLCIGQAATEFTFLEVMENAVAELQQENNGGVLVWFLEILWAQSSKRINSDNDAVPPAAYYKDFPYIPHSVVFNYSHAQGWFFEPASVKASSGSRRIRRKRRQHLVARDIFEELTAGSSDLRGDHLIVAQLITRQSPQSLQPRCNYLTRDALYQLLFHGTIAEGSILQKFVFPQGAHSNGLKNGNSTLTISWQPSYCYVERHVNQIPLDDRSYTPKERGATSEAPRNITTSALGNNSSTLHACRRACNAMAEHVRIVTGIHIRSLTCVVKITQSNEVALMFVQRAAIVENDKLTPSIGLLLGGSVSDDDEDHDSHLLGDTNELTQGQKEYLMELKRCPSSQRRDYLVSLLPEDLADSKFDKIAPKSWVLRGRDFATRFQGRSASACSASTNRRSLSRNSEVDRATPSLRPASSSAVFSQGRSPRATSPALGATRTLVSFENTNTFGASPTVGSFRSIASMKVGKGLGNSMMREVEQDMTLKTQGTVVVRSDWNEEPTRIEVSLMRDATTDYFPLKKVAHNVAALGLREKYLASMRAASSGLVSSKK